MDIYKEDCVVDDLSVVDGDGVNDAEDVVDNDDDEDVVDNDDGDGVDNDDGEDVEDNKISPSDDIFVDNVGVCWLGDIDEVGLDS